MEAQKRGVNKRVLLGVLKLRWLMLAVIMLALTLCTTGCVSPLAPTYSATDRFMVLNYYEYGDKSVTQIDAAEKLTEQYCFILNTNDFCDVVVDKLNEIGPNTYKREDIASKIRFAPSSKGFFNLTVTAQDPEEVEKIIMVCEELAPTYILQKTHTDSNKEKIAIVDHGDIRKNLR